MANFTSVLSKLEQERRRLTSQLAGLNNALSALNQTGENGPRRGTMSSAGRARVAAAQRARWAKGKGPKVVSITRGRCHPPPAERSRPRRGLDGPNGGGDGRRRDPLRPRLTI